MRPTVTPQVAASEPRALTPTMAPLPLVDTSPTGPSQKAEVEAIQKRIIHWKKVRADTKEPEDVKACDACILQLSERLNTLQPNHERLKLATKAAEEASERLQRNKVHVAKAQESLSEAQKQYDSRIAELDEVKRQLAASSPSSDVGSSDASVQMLELLRQLVTTAVHNNGVVTVPPETMAHISAVVTRTRSPSPVPSAATPSASPVRHAPNFDLWSEEGSAKEDPYMSGPAVSPEVAAQVAQTLHSAESVFHESAEADPGERPAVMRAFGGARKSRRTSQEAPGFSPY